MLLLSPVFLFLSLIDVIGPVGDVIGVCRGSPPLLPLWCAHDSETWPEGTEEDYPADFIVIILFSVREKTQTVVAERATANSDMLRLPPQTSG